MIAYGLGIRGHGRQGRLVVTPTSILRWLPGYLCAQQCSGGEPSRVGEARVLARSGRGRAGPSPLNRSRVIITCRMHPRNGSRCTSSSRRGSSSVRAANCGEIEGTAPSQRPRRRPMTAIAPPHYWSRGPLLPGALALWPARAKQVSTSSAHSALSTGRQRDPPPATPLPGRPPLLHGVPNQHVPTVILSLSFLAEQQPVCPLPPFAFAPVPQVCPPSLALILLSPRPRLASSSTSLKKIKRSLGAGLALPVEAACPWPRPQFPLGPGSHRVTVFLRNRPLLIGSCAHRTHGKVMVVVVVVRNTCVCNVGISQPRATCPLSPPSRGQGEGRGEGKIWVFHLFCSISPLDVCWEHVDILHRGKQRKGTNGVRDKKK